MNKSKLLSDNNKKFDKLPNTEKVEMAEEILENMATNIASQYAGSFNDDQVSEAIKVEIEGILKSILPKISHNLSVDLHSRNEEIMVDIY